MTRYFVSVNSKWFKTTTNVWVLENDGSISLANSGVNLVHTNVDYVYIEHWVNTGQIVEVSVPDDRRFFLDTDVSVDDPNTTVWFTEGNDLWWFYSTLPHEIYKSRYLQPSDFAVAFDGTVEMVVS